MKKFLVLGFLIALIESVYAVDNANTNAPNHQLRGLVDRTTGQGVDDARRVFPMMKDGAIFDTTDRDVGTVLVYQGEGVDSTGNSFAYYTHQPYTNSNGKLMTNNYVYFYQRNGTNILRITDGTTNHYDISFGKAPIPTNNIPVITYSEVSGMVGDNNFIRMSGTATYNGSILTNSIYFEQFGDIVFNRQPAVSVQIKGNHDKLMVVYVEAFKNKLDYYIRDTSGPVTENIDIYWSALGTIDEVISTTENLDDSP